MSVDHTHYCLNSWVDFLFIERMSFLLSPQPQLTQNGKSLLSAIVLQSLQFTDVEYVQFRALHLNYALTLSLYFTLKLLHQIACTKGKRKCVKLLVTSGANMESKSFLKETPLECLNTVNADDRRIIMHLLRKKEASSRRRSESKGDD